MQHTCSILADDPGAEFGDGVQLGVAEVQVASVEEDAMIGKMKAQTNLKIKELTL